MILDRILGKILLPFRPAARLAVRLKRTYRVTVFRRKDHKTIEVCGARMPRPETDVNIDCLDAPEVDIVHVLPEKLPFDDHTIDHIISSATLEHFNIHDIRRILQDFYRILKPGGEIAISMPGLHKILARYQKTGATDELLRYLHGGQKDNYDIHLCVLDAERLMQEIRRCGFGNIQEVEYDAAPHAPEYMLKIIALKSCL